MSATSESKTCDGVAGARILLRFDVTAPAALLPRDSASASISPPPVQYLFHFSMLRFKIVLQDNIYSMPYDNHFTV